VFLHAGVFGLQVREVREMREAETVLKIIRNTAADNLVGSKSYSRLLPCFGVFIDSCSF
jgi:hypothetical protein